MNPQTNARRAAALRRRRMARRRLLALATIAAIVIGLIIWLVISIAGKATYTPQETPKAATIEPQDTSSKTPTGAPESTPESTPEPTGGSPAYYYITDEERALIEQVVSAESRGEPFEGQVAVAQCILNACLKEKAGPAEVIKKYKYTKKRVEPTDSVKLAVSKVFDYGEMITDEPIIYFYNPSLVTSEFHESQTFVIQIANHKFFKEAE